MPDEIDFVLDFCLHILRSFGFEEFKAYLSTMPEKCVGEPEQWEAAQDALQSVLERAEVEYEVDEGGRRVLRPQDRPQRSATHWAANGSVRRSSSTLTCPSGSIWSTWARMGNHTGPT